jgi:hypothetical protein
MKPAASGLRLFLPPKTGWAALPHSPEPVSRNRAPLCSSRTIMIMARSSARAPAVPVRPTSGVRGFPVALRRPPRLPGAGCGRRVDGDHHGQGPQD